MELSVHVKGFLIFNLIFLISSCAFVRHEVLDKANVCLTLTSKYQVQITNRETVTGSYHTPFDYGNKSISDQVYTFEVSSIDNKTDHNNIKSWLNSKLINSKSGTLNFSTDNVYANIDFGGFHLQGKALITRDNINQCKNAL
jgi:hypothetical protein